MKKALFFLVMVLFTQGLSALQLGDGTDVDRNLPVHIMDDVKQVSSSGWNTFILNNDGTLFGCGLNAKGELGIGSFDKQSTPVKIAENVIEFCVGGNICGYIKEDGTLWIMGRIPEVEKSVETNRYVQKNVNVPRFVDSDVAKIVTEGLNVLYLKKDGTLWGFGKNDYGILGLGDRTYRTTPVLIREGIKDLFLSSNTSMIIDDTDTVYMAGNNPWNPQQFNLTYSKLAENCYTMSEGFYITKQHQLWSFGWGYYGSLGTGEYVGLQLPTHVMDNIKKVSANQDHALILTENGDVYITGGGDPSIGVKEHGTCSSDILWHPKHSFSNIRDVEVGLYSSFIIDDNAELWGFGLNSIQPLQ